MEYSWDVRLILTRPRYLMTWTAYHFDQANPDLWGGRRRGAGAHPGGRRDWESSGNDFFFDRELLNGEHHAGTDSTNKGRAGPTSPAPEQPAGIEQVSGITSFFSTT